jgi:hypothetical protein
MAWVSGVTMRWWAAAIVAAAVVAVPARGEVVRLEITERRDWAGGQDFGAGQYEYVAGTAWYEIDPASPQARDITDIRLAPRNARGRVEYRGPFLILRPKDASRANGTTVVEVPNRGGDQTNRLLFFASGFDIAAPGKTTEVTHGPLFDRGYTFAWAGWQADLKPDGFGLTVPRARVHGTARASAYVNVDGASGDIGSVETGGSCAADANDPTAILRVQRRFDDPGEVVPRARWRFARREGGRVVADPCQFLLDTPVKGPALVTVTYRGDQPLVVGLGLAAQRDFASYLRRHAVAGGPLPRALIGYGYSQSARFLRDFLYRGFNRDPATGARVFDGVMDVAAGAGRGAFNHRYARPGEAGNSVGSALRAVDLYPFADLPTPDIAGRAQEGLLDRARAERVQPRLFHILSGSEYWARAGSLMQASPDGRRALPEAPDTRTYAFAGTNHGPRPSITWLSPGSDSRYPFNDNADVFAALPALTEAMRRWIVEGAPPPATQRAEAGKTLVEASRLAFPAIPGVTAPKSPPPVWQLDLGPEYRTAGIVAEPPRVGARYTLLVPQVDEDGNEIGGWHGLRRSLPLGTYTAWNRSRRGELDGFGILSGLSGGFIPFTWNEEERVAGKDPRRSLVERYGGRAGYLRAADKEIERQVAAGFLLPDERAWTRISLLADWVRVESLTYLWPTAPTPAP